MSEPYPGATEFRAAIERLMIAEPDKPDKEEWTERFLDRLRDIINGHAENPFSQAFAAGESPETLADDITQLVAEDQDDGLDEFRSVWKNDQDTE